MSTLSQNREYLKGIADQLKPIPSRLVIETAVRTYQKVLQYTAFDSGQAMANWRIRPYMGSPTYEEQDMLWGYGDVTPVAPVGYKWRDQWDSNQQLVMAYLIEESMIASISLKNVSFDGITVYNPISPGFASFNPGSDLQYEYNALGGAKAQFSGLVAEALDEAEDVIASEFTFLRKS